jgi:hypothetical protein
MTEITLQPEQIAFTRPAPDLLATLPPVHLISPVALVDISAIHEQTGLLMAYDPRTNSGALIASREANPTWWIKTPITVDDFTQLVTETIRITTAIADDPGAARH